MEEIVLAAEALYCTVVVLPLRVTIKDGYMDLMYSTRTKQSQRYLLCKCT